MIALKDPVIARLDRAISLRDAPVRPEHDTR
jgi:hypothetical protein